LSLCSRRIMSNSGLYVHVPFCRTKCAYCGFVSRTDLSLAPLWLDALEREARLYRDFSGPFDSLFLGGGTPTVLSPSQLEWLTNCLLMGFSFADSTEFTVEANPDDITSDMLALLNDLGVNRVSLGVQSLQEKELAFLGRRHSAIQAEEALDQVRRAGFKSLSIDLIYGLPDQTISSWLKTLRRALTFEPDHLSCYQLTLEKHTPLGKMVAEKKIRKAGLKEERELFLVTSQFLEQEGYLHYEVSNFARPGHLCRHNLKYWDRTPYLGLGPAAHSFDGNARWWNTRSIRRYQQRLLCGHAPIAGKEILSEENRIMECLLLGLRTTKGIEIDLVRDVPGLGSRVKHLEDSGLVIIREGRVLPTREGLLYADGLPLLFT
jgi:putative oxygen-independent coproporphyrinogen III oxidase